MNTTPNYQAPQTALMPLCWMHRGHCPVRGTSRPPWLSKRPQVQTPPSALTSAGVFACVYGILAVLLPAVTTTVLPSTDSSCPAQVPALWGSGRDAGIQCWFIQKPLIDELTSGWALKTWQRPVNGYTLLQACVRCERTALLAGQGSSFAQS